MVIIYIVATYNQKFHSKVGYNILYSSVKLTMILFTNYDSHYCDECNRLEMTLSRVTNYDSHYCGESIINN